MQYHKINSIFKRDEKGNFLDGQFSDDVFWYLWDCPWMGYEKVDGTNVRLYPTGVFGGRTDRAQFSLEQEEFLRGQVEMVTSSEHTLPDEAVVYGEMYGGKIQNGGHYRPDLGFVVFDVWLGNRFMTYSERVEYCAVSGFEMAPFLDMATLEEWLWFCKDGRFKESFLKCGGRNEGYVLVPSVNLRDIYGHRVITKLKFKDFNTMDMEVNRGNDGNTGEPVRNREVPAGS